MPKFNPDNYTPVKVRKNQFWQDYPEGAIHVEPMSSPKDATEYVLLRASIWKDKVHMHQGFGPDGQGISLSIAGGDGADRTSWTENCEESAVGRALDNLGYNDGKCSREEIVQAERHADIEERGGITTAYDKNNETIPFGKHKGQKWIELPQHYLKWLQDNATNDEYRKKATEILLAQGFIDTDDETPF